MARNKGTEGSARSDQSTGVDGIAATGVFKGWRNRRGAPVDVIPPERGALTGVVTDQRLLQHVYAAEGREVHPVATDTFLDKSRTEYNSSWLSRELIQNFVDHNPHEPGTLDGVEITQVALSDGYTRFEISGGWAFDDPTGVISPHSDKPQGVHTAGGNGIGLKQTAIRLMRDFGARKFQIEGNGWAVDYQLARASDVNARLSGISAPGEDHAMRHDWLMADITQTPNRTTTTYTIETDNNELTQALAQLPELGVSRQNSYLQHPSFKNDKGAIKWLTSEDLDHPERSRLYINGQVMNYRQKGSTSADYWRGPEGVTIQLNNVDYRMTIDRPPVSSGELNRYLHELTRSMTLPELIGQLHASEHLWRGMSGGRGFDNPGALELVSAMLWALETKGYDKSQYKELFSDRPYLFAPRSLDATQTKMLQQQGYILCPAAFEKLGMPSALSKLDVVHSASNDAPETFKSRQAQKRMASELGIQVSYEPTPVPKNAGELVEMLKEQLLKHVADIDVRDDQNALFFAFDQSIPESLCAKAVVGAAEGPAALLNDLRGIAWSGLQAEGVTKLYVTGEGYILTFATDYDFELRQTDLIQKLVEVQSTGSGILIEFDPEQYGMIKTALTKQQLEAVPQGVVTPARGGDSGHMESLTDLPAEFAFTEEGQRLYQQAMARSPENRSPEDEAIIKHREDLAAQMDAIPIVHMEPEPRFRRERPIVELPSTITDAEKTRIQGIAEDLPDIIEAVTQLEESVPRPAVSSTSNWGEVATEKYLQWRASGGYRRELAGESGYLSPRSLLDIIEDYNQVVASIPRVERTGEGAGESPEEVILKATKDKLKDVGKRLGVAKHEVDQFEIVFNPTENQLAQLGLLRMFMNLTNGVDIPNDLFLYDGTGRQGINLDGKAIGLHTALLGVDFNEAIGTFVHEVAHNNSSDHGPKFQKTMETLFMATVDKLQATTHQLVETSVVTDRVRMLASIKADWDALRERAQQEVTAYLESGAQVDIAGSLEQQS